MEAYVAQLGLVVLEVVAAQPVDLPFFGYVGEAGCDFFAETVRESVSALVLVVAFNVRGLRNKKLTFIRGICRIYVRTGSIWDYEALAFTSVEPCCAKRGTA